MINPPKFKVTVQSKTGLREDYRVDIIGPETDYFKVPISISGTVFKIWENTDGKINHLLIVEELMRGVVATHGTSKTPPQKGFFFDSYNSGLSIKDTINKIRNFGIEPFIKETSYSTSLRAVMGNKLFSEIDKLNSLFATKYGKKLFKSFEDFSEDSRLRTDLSNPPKDLANFLYRVCILSVIIDHLDIHLPSEDSKTQSLNAFKKWLDSLIDQDKQTALTETLVMVKYLRKQYPIHESYTISSTGIKKEKSQITSARNFFDLKEDYESNWKKVLDKFTEAIKAIREVLE